MRTEKEIREVLEDRIKLDKALGVENLRVSSKRSLRSYARKFGRWVLESKEVKR